MRRSKAVWGAARTRSLDDNIRILLDKYSKDQTQPTFDECGYILLLPCKIWTLSTDDDGYARRWMSKDTVYLMHREAHRILNNNGKEFDGLCCHKCGIPCCIQGEHLYEGTYTDNNRDTVRQGQWANGHTRKG